MKNGWKYILTDDVITDMLKRVPDDSKPSKDKIFRAFEYFEPEDTKVVIIGEDPYPNGANGLSFSQDSHSAKNSLKNIFKCLEITHGLRSDPDLEDWARQGVLLMNTYLTLGPNKEKHQFWEPITNYLIEYVSIVSDKCVFVLLGKKAQKKKKLIDDRHVVISLTHPSPMNRNNKEFINSGLFSLIDDNIDTDIKWL